jgi:hypothetical protein
MNVTPELVNHPRFLGLKAALRECGQEGQALEFLVRLWGHCQVGQRGENWGKKEPLYVEMVCLWGGEPGKLFKILTQDYMGEGPWVRVDKRGVVTVMNWAKHNAKLVTAWRNGVYGGRPPKREGVSTAKPKGNRTETHGLSVGRGRDKLMDRSGVDRSGVEQGTETHPHGEAQPDQSQGQKAGIDPEYHWPTWAEWMGAAEMEGLTPEQIKAEWDNQERKPPAQRWARVDVSRLRFHASFVREQIRLRGGNRSAGGVNSQKGGGESATAVRIGAENRLKMLELKIKEHEANSASEYAVAEPTEEQKADLARLRREVDKVRKELLG